MGTASRPLDSDIWRRSRIRERLDWRLVPFVVGLIWLVVILVSRPMPLYDGKAYWVTDGAQPYAVSGEGQLLAYLYSPAFLQLIAPIRALPYEWFGVVWVLITASALVAITRHWLPIALLIPVTMIELEVGNIHFLLAAAVYLGFRYPGVWAFVLLTKVTPGIGLIWFAARREWRSLAIALGATALVIGVSVLVVPGQWVSWYDSLAGNAQQQFPYPLFPVPLWTRLAGAAVLVAWGARSNRRWTVLVGSTLALPTLWPANLAMLAGLPLFVDRMKAR